MQIYFSVVVVLGLLPIPECFQFRIKETPRGLCAVTGDPHIGTIDGQWYDLFDVGQFVLWKSNTPREFEVCRMLFKPFTPIA